MIVPGLYHDDLDGKTRRYYYMRTLVQPLGYVIALSCRCGYHDYKNKWMINDDTWDNVTEIRTPTLQEVEAHWGRLQPGDMSRVATIL